eukprot:269202-Chlamydomonas_euryale.AAC.3
MSSPCASCFERSSDSWASFAASAAASAAATSAAEDAAAEDAATPVSTLRRRSEYSASEVSSCCACARVRVHECMGSQCGRRNNWIRPTWHQLAPAVHPCVL